MIKGYFFVLITSILTINLHGLLGDAVSSTRPINYEEVGGHIEGDIKVPILTRAVAIRGDYVRWPSGTVPYEISSEYATPQRNAIISAMRTMESLTAVNNVPCVTFRERVAADKGYYIYIYNGPGCSSYVGRYTGYSLNRTVSLQHPGCIYSGIIMHELIHALGFDHEQSRPDRDTYVKINLNAIQSGYESNFGKRGNSEVNIFNTSYDYGSVMHYERNAFSKDNSDTIVPIFNTTAVIGQRITMSPIDIEEVRLFYGCYGTGTTSSSISKPTTTTVRTERSTTTTTSTARPTTTTASTARPTTTTTSTARPITTTASTTRPTTTTVRTERPITTTTSTERPITTTTNAASPTTTIISGTKTIADSSTSKITVISTTITTSASPTKATDTSSSTLATTSTSTIRSSTTNTKAKDTSSSTSATTSTTNIKSSTTNAKATDTSSSTLATTSTSTIRSSTTNTKATDTSSSTSATTSTTNIKSSTTNAKATDTSSSTLATTSTTNIRSSTTTTSISTSNSKSTRTTSPPKCIVSITLTRNCSRYHRIGGTSSNYYYITTQITISVSDTYTFKSSSNFATYCFLYSNSFNPRNPSLNLVAQGRNSAGNGMLQFTTFLSVGGKRTKQKRDTTTYVLVSTTEDPDITGNATTAISGESGGLATIIGSDDDDDNGKTAGIIAGSVIGGILLLTCLCGLCVAGILYCLYCMKGKPLRSNGIYVRDRSGIQNETGNNIFQPNSFTGFAFKDGSWHGPQNLTLAFYPQANNTVYGKGTDQFGTFVATGVYSPKTLRIAFDKRYQAGLGNAGSNSVQAATVQAAWNPNTQSFEGKSYLKTGKNREEQRYIMQMANAKYNRYP